MSSSVAQSLFCCDFKTATKKAKNRETKNNYKRDITTKFLVPWRPGTQYLLSPIFKYWSFVPRYYNAKQ
jgi:hypothetical protein